MVKAVESETIFEVVAGFICPAGTFVAGQLFRSDDPIVAKYAEQFRPVKLATTVKAKPEPEPRVERAEARPGEKRGA